MPESTPPVPPPTVDDLDRNLVNDYAYYVEHNVDEIRCALIRRAVHAETNMEAAACFKAFVHSYLTEHGVPEGDPDNHNQKEGCRIGARLDLLFAQRDEARAEVEKLRGVIAQHDLCHDLHGKVNARAFADGCAAEQRKLYGHAPDADKIKELEAYIHQLQVDIATASTQAAAMLTALKPCLAILRHKEIRPSMNPGVQEQLEKQVAAAMTGEVGKSILKRLKVLERVATAAAELFERAEADTGVYVMLAEERLRLRDALAAAQA